MNSMQRLRYYKILARTVQIVQIYLFIRRHTHTHPYRTNRLKETNDEQPFFQNSSASARDSLVANQVGMSFFQIPHDSIYIDRKKVLIDKASWNSTSRSQNVFVFWRDKISKNAHNALERRIRNLLNYWDGCRACFVDQTEPRVSHSERRFHAI